MRCNKPSLPLGKIMESSTSLLMEFQRCNRPSVKVPLQRDIKWKPLEGSVVKTNIDGAMLVDLDQARIGVVI